MDIIFVRTKLHALIVLNLISKDLISKNFIFVKHHWKDVNEDSKKNDFFYSKIEGKAFYTTCLVEKNGLIRCSLQVYLLSILAFISCGKFYLAAIRTYAISIAAKLNPLLRIVTFDDGLDNIFRESDNPFFLKKALDDNSSFFRGFLNFLFPHGSASFLRKKTILHYTIFKNIGNIVPKEKLKYIKVNWESYLSNEDMLFLKGFVKSEVSILIGTPFQEVEHSRLRDERKRNFIKNFQKEFLPEIDLIISHPRDSSNISHLKIAESFHGTAESVIKFLQNQSMVNKINILHFGTTSAPIIRTLSKVKIYDIYAGCYAIGDNQGLIENG